MATLGEAVKLAAGAQRSASKPAAWMFGEVLAVSPLRILVDDRFEIGAEQGEDLTHLMNERGFSEVKVHKDLAGLDRIVTGIYSRK